MNLLRNSIYVMSYNLLVPVLVTREKRLPIKHRQHNDSLNLEMSASRGFFVCKGGNDCIRFKSIVPARGGVETAILLPLV